MQAAQILEIKPFMQLLLQSDSFDAYELVSATLRTDMTYSIDGAWNKDFFDETEIDTLNLSGCTYLPWRLAKDRILSLIRGKKTPAVMKLVFRMNCDELNTFLSASNSSHNINDIDGVHFNLLFQEQKLNVTCSVSYKIFTLDKHLEQEIFNNFITLLKANNISTS